MSGWNKGSRELSISTKIEWRIHRGNTEVRTDTEDADEQRNSLLDALHIWIVEGERRGKIKLRLPDGTSGAVLEAVGTLLASLERAVVINVEPRPAPAPDFVALAGTRWLGLLQRRDELLADLPDLAKHIKAAVNDPSFQWHKTLTSALTGRVDGLVVCEIHTPTTGILKIGASENGRKLFREIAGANELAMTERTVARDAAVIRACVESRREGPLNGIQREHLLEARILRNEVPIKAPSGRRMTPAIKGGQLPTRWSTGGRAKYLDALMRDQGDLWAVELKIRSGGAGKYLRHGVGQAVLYREFIRGAATIHQYLAASGADPAACHAAVAFPALDGVDGPSRTADVRSLAELFGVQVLELDAPGF